MGAFVFSGREIGHSSPVFIVAEIGINHNGDYELAMDLVRSAAKSGVDAVKFQKRNPELSVPEDQRLVMRDTPWGRMSYLDYRYRLEFDRQQYLGLKQEAEKFGLVFFASPWDMDSFDFLLDLNLDLVKIASASLTDLELISAVARAGIPTIASTGMSSLDEIDRAYQILSVTHLALMHSTSSYPCQLPELNLKVIPQLRQRYGCPVGYSGHEVGIPTSVAAVALGACIIERHFTLDRTLWGSDQAASLEPKGMETMVRHIRAVEVALGDGIKRVYESELPSRDRLRRVK
mgnify:CR=1 FL=1